jgi:hypothetical protein
MHVEKPAVASGENKAAALIATENRKTPAKPTSGPSSTGVGIQKTGSSLKNGNHSPDILSDYPKCLRGFQGTETAFSKHSWG